MLSGFPEKWMKNKPFMATKRCPTIRFQAIRGTKTLIFVRTPQWFLGNQKWKMELSMAMVPQWLDGFSWKMSEANPPDHDVKAWIWTKKHQHFVWNMRTKSRRCHLMVIIYIYNGYNLYTVSVISWERKNPVNWNCTKLSTCIVRISVVILAPNLGLPNFGAFICFYSCHVI